jgi:hypothetical protein
MCDSRPRLRRWLDGFGAYFSYFSAFLMISALLLAALFFRLSIEQRLAQIGVLRATGFSLADIRRLFLLEAAAIVAAGTILGIALAIGWAALMMFALRTWWIGAVGTTQLHLRVDAMSLLAGAAGAALAAFATIAWTVRFARPLYAARTTLRHAGPVGDSPTRRVAVSGVHRDGGHARSTGVRALHRSRRRIFWAGALILVGGLAIYRAWIARRRLSHAGLVSVRTLGQRNTSWRPGRSVAVAGLIAAAVFVLVSVDAFRRGTPAVGARDRAPGGSRCWLNPRFQSCRIFKRPTAAGPSGSTTARAVRWPARRSSVSACGRATMRVA